MEVLDGCIDVSRWNMRTNCVKRRELLLEDRGNLEGQSSVFSVDHDNFPPRPDTPPVWHPTAVGT
jgi:hypothetical protein